jgi:hypothetical protein
MSKQNPQEDVKEVNYYRIEGDTKHLAGQILTIIDASIADKQQNKAIKDLVKVEISEYLHRWQKLYWDNKDGMPLKGHSINLEQ